MFEFDRRFGHLRIRDVRSELVRAVLHQLREREAAAAVLPARVQARAGRIPKRKAELDEDRVLRQPAVHRFNRSETGRVGLARRRMQNAERQRRQLGDELVQPAFEKTQKLRQTANFEFGVYHQAFRRRRHLPSRRFRF